MAFQNALLPVSCATSLAPPRDLAMANTMARGSQTNHHRELLGTCGGDS